MSKWHDLGDEYTPETFNPENNPNYTKLPLHRSKRFRCARCEKKAVPKVENVRLSYHTPTCLYFCDECIWNIEKLTIDDLD